MHKILGYKININRLNNNLINLSLIPYNEKNIPNNSFFGQAFLFCSLCQKEIYHMMIDVDICFECGDNLKDELPKVNFGEFILDHRFNNSVNFKLLNNLIINKKI